MTMEPLEYSVFEEKKSDVTEFFEKLGYKVTWDFNNSGRWWEIQTTNHVTFVQIDMGIPLSAILQDFCCFREGSIRGTSGYDYQVNVRPGHEEEFKELLEKV
jgi:hypothetical protein